MSRYLIVTFFLVMATIATGVFVGMGHGLFTSKYAKNKTPDRQVQTEFTDMRDMRTSGADADRVTTQTEPPTQAAEQDQAVTDATSSAEIEAAEIEAAEIEPQISEPQISDSVTAATELDITRDGEATNSNTAETTGLTENGAASGRDIIIDPTAAETANAANSSPDVGETTAPLSGDAAPQTASGETSPQTETASLGTSENSPILDPAKSKPTRSVTRPRARGTQDTRAQDTRALGSAGQNNQNAAPSQTTPAQTAALPSTAQPEVEAIEVITPTPETAQAALPTGIIPTEFELDGPVSQSAYDTEQKPEKLLGRYYVNRASQVMIGTYR